MYFLLNGNDSRWMNECTNIYLSNLCTYQNGLVFLLRPPLNLFRFRAQTSGTSCSRNYEVINVLRNRSVFQKSALYSGYPLLLFTGMNTTATYRDFILLTRTNIDNPSYLKNLRFVRHDTIVFVVGKLIIMQLHAHTVKILL